MLAAALLVALCGAAGAGGGGGVRPAPVAVPRCCPRGQHLDPAALALDPLPRAVAAAACRAPPPGAAPAAWEPRVYAPARRAYLERGRLPAHWREAAAALPPCAELRVLHEHAAPFALLANNGSLQVAGPPPAALPPDRYCADARAALACLGALPAAARAAKCCAPANAFDGARCVADAARAAAALAELGALGGAAPRYGWPACANGSRYAVVGLLGGAALAADGALSLGAERLAAGAWCAESLTGRGAAGAGAGEGGSGARVLSCASAARAADESPPLRHALYGAALAVGAVFLALTLAAGCALPAAHHALHWRCQTHYVAALMLGDALLAGTQLAGAAVPPPLCRALAVCMHFLFLSAFFWLNTMCFNIWWTFRDFRPTSLERAQEACRLRVYMVYAWGGPLLLAGAAAVLDGLPPPDSTSDSGTGALLRPRFGERRCWFYGDMEILVYFFGPVGVLLLVNLALFASTARQLTCGLWRRDEVKATSERAALGRVCAKLVVVMGVTWGADVVSWAVGGPHAAWYATDLLNALQGLLIFLVVGCQPHACAALRRACWPWGRAGAGRRGRARAQHNPTHSSTHLPSCGESLTHTTPAPAPAPALGAGAGPGAAPAKLPMETVC